MLIIILPLYWSYVNNYCRKYAQKSHFIIYFLFYRKKQSGLKNHLLMKVHMLYLSHNLKIKECHGEQQEHPCEKKEK